MNPLDENIAEQEDYIEQKIIAQRARTAQIDHLRDKIARLEERLHKASEAYHEIKEERESVELGIRSCRQFVKDEIAARKQVRQLVRKHDDLHLDDEASPNSAQVWVGEWQENMEYLDTWQDVLDDARHLVRDL